MQSGEEFEIEVGGESVKVLPVWVGNPQCVVFVESQPSKVFFERIGAALETHPFFPEKTNVSFVEVLGSHNLRIQIWERGVGPTYSSGTGSSGAAVAAISSRRARSPVAVSTATGTQTVEWGPSEPIRLTGQATLVADADFYWEG
jgi:diaminopimelate epimerase